MNRVFVWLLYPSYHTTTGLSMEPPVYVTTILRRLLQVRENYIWIWYTNITVEYYCHVWHEACDVCMNFVPSYLLLISWPSNLKSNSIRSPVGTIYFKHFQHGRPIPPDRISIWDSQGARYSHHRGSNQEPLDLMRGVYPTTLLGYPTADLYISMHR